LAISAVWLKQQTPAVVYDQGVNSDKSFNEVLQTGVKKHGQTAASGSRV